MENKELNSLIDAFIGYREMLSPIQADMHEFLDTYGALKSDIEKLNSAFDGNVQTKLNEIYKQLSSQAEKSEELTRKVDQFLKSSSRYTEEVDKLIETFKGIEGRIANVNDIEQKAEEQISRLDTILEEKKRNYDLKDLKKSIDSYNSNLQSVADFVNKDIAENIVSNSNIIKEIKEGNQNIAKQIQDEGVSIIELVDAYKSSNEILKKIVEKKDVNEAYIFDILDKWAEDRKVKIKK